jgi:rhamnogalacturonyl hydrolase YesR
LNVLRASAGSILVVLLLAAVGCAGDRVPAPSAESITDVLQRVHARLDSDVGAKLINRATGEEVTKASQPTTSIVFETGTSLRAGPYSYPMGVVYSGMLASYEVTGDQRYANFVSKRFQVFADHLPSVEAWPDDQKRRSPFRSMLRPANLDACGAMGAAMIRARRDGAFTSDMLKPVIDRFAEYVSTKQFRLEDGTLARRNPRPASVWGDDAYMSVPLLAQMGKLTGETKYLDDGVKQMRQMSKLLFDSSKQLYTHGWTQGKPQDTPKFYWGRANGWCIMALVELIDALPENHPDRAEMIVLLRSHARGLAATQAPDSGMWRQLLDHPEFPTETSCTAMFTYAIARGVNRGWLDEHTYRPVAIRGWNGLCTKIDDQGRVDGTCVGTNYRDSLDHYLKRKLTDDIHGYGPVLLAGSEMLRLSGVGVPPALAAAKRHESSVIR